MCIIISSEDSIYNLGVAASILQVDSILLHFWGETF